MQASEASDVSTNVGHFRLVLYLNFASATIIVYDYLLTVGLEVHHLWPKQGWNLIRIMFFVNRYLPFIDITLGLWAEFVPSMTTQGCTLVDRLAGWSFCFSIALSEVILTMRTWSLWKTKRWSGTALVVFYLSCWTPIVVVFGTFLMNANVRSFQLQQYGGCIILPENINLYLCWILVLVYDTGIMILMVLAVTKPYAQMLLKSGGSSALVRTLYRDVLSVMNIATIVVLPGDLVNLFTVLQRAIHSTLTSRVILHLREQAEHNILFDPLAVK
ncbi:hypothetical protein EYR40_011088 [Pleurotus pulmonarius]|nr:hypothetical protein EYR36_002856 [Pleurotus pulmonarius]KAF4583628.1 hypothetical protein EYR38_002383 [Pleurotus pulmonarius]KAF4587067.1 hypothetical protein EYR40_011088 [Pleurotus pulmonarius]